MNKHEKQASTTQLGDTFKSMMTDMLRNWHVKDLDDIAYWNGKYKEIYERVGHDRFRRGYKAALQFHATGFLPDVSQFLAYVPDPPQRQDNWQHSEAEWAAIRREQETPEFKQHWQKFLDTIRTAESTKRMEAK